jgi:levanase/fructan beta-fructosidase
MVLYGGGSYFLFTSSNLLEWTELKESIPESYECPDMFRLPVDGDLARQKWVLVRGNGKYSVGEFDGLKFTEETPQRSCDTGPNFYATQSWGEIEGQEGRRVQIAWMRDGKYPDMPFNQQMTFPSNLTLRTWKGSFSLFRKPAPEIERLHSKTHSWTGLTLEPGAPMRLDAAGDLFRIVADLEIPENSSLSFRIRGTPVALTRRSIACRSKPASATEPVRTVEILIDRTSIETFVNDGEISHSACFLPADDRLELVSEGQSVHVRSLRVIELQSIWNR